MQDGKDPEILVPLTSSLYVKGKMADREKVLVDVGTGFYVEKVCDFFFFFFLCLRLFQMMKRLTLPPSVATQTTEKAIAFYNEKVKGLDSNLQELEKIVHSKSTQLKAVEEGEFGAE